MNAIPRIFRGETLALSLVFGLFLAANLATAERSPAVWQDEVMFADPAVNLYLGKGFRTSAWYQSREIPFAGNSPLYSLCLYPWICAFGFKITAVRSLNYVLVIASASLLGLALRRFGLVRSVAAGLLLAALVLCGDGVTFSYRSGRYDCLGMLLLAGMVFTLSLRTIRAQAAGLFALAAVVPWVGLQLIPYTALLALVLLLVRGRSAIPLIAAFGAGGLIGSGLLCGYFWANGVWPDFVTSVRAIGTVKRPLGTRIEEALRAPLTEPSSIGLLIAIAVLLADDFWRREARLRSPLVVGLVLGIFVPAALSFVGKYPRYYTWMAYIPMAACVAAHLDRGRVGPAAKGAVALLLLLACAVGLPARLAVTCLEWKLRDVEPVRQLVARHVGPDDWVFSEFEAYYPAKTRAGLLFLPPYIGDANKGQNGRSSMTSAERDRIDVLITKPDAEENTLRFFGGDWSPVGRYAADQADRVGLLKKIGFGSRPYELIIYRRQPGPVGVADGT